MRRTDAVGIVALCALVGIAAGTGRVPDAGALLRGLCVAAWIAASGVATWLAFRAQSMRLVLGVAVLLRVIVLPMMPTLSDDVYRYLWDGRLAVSGISPYAEPPAAGALDVFRAEGDNAVLFERMNSQGVHSVYPPVSQAAFGAAALAGSWTAGWFVLKLLLLLAEGVGVLAMSRVLTPSRLALYAWQPLAVLEIAGQGHTEGLLVGAIGVTIWALRRDRAGWAALGVVATGWTKLFPFVALPALLLRAGWRGRILAVAATALLGLALLRADGLANLLTSLRLYGGALDFYSAPFLAAKAALYPWLGDAAGRFASMGLALPWLAVVGWSSLGVWRRGLDPEIVLVVTFVGYALVTPMLHPWNGLGALAVVPVMRRPAAVLWLLGAAPLTYMRYVAPGGPWYGAALVIGWGGAAWWAWRQRSMSASASSVASSTGSVG